MIRPRATHECPRRTIVMQITGAPVEPIVTLIIAAQYFLGKPDGENSPSVYFPDCQGSSLKAEGPTED